jgi:hypothetical protein
MSNFLIETSILRASMKLGKYEGAPIAAEYRTNSIVDMTEYVQDAIGYFTSMVQFEADVKSVSILVRVYRDHHVIFIERNEFGKVVVTTNQ